MTDKTYPQAHHRHLVRRVEHIDASGTCRTWTGNDESYRNHNGKVRLSESPLTINLSWKKSPREPIYFIGTFELELKRLLEDDYIRLEANSSNEIRLRFYHDRDNKIYIQTSSKELRLPIGIMPLEGTTDETP